MNPPLGKEPLQTEKQLSSFEPLDMHMYHLDIKYPRFCIKLQMYVYIQLSVTQIKQLLNVILAIGSRSKIEPKQIARETLASSLLCVTDRMSAGSIAGALYHKL